MAARSMAKARRRDRRRAPRAPRRVRYAVVGLGWIAQDSILPAFARARANSELYALVSDDSAKLRILGRKYGVSRLYGYEDYERCLRDVDAVFIALPNSRHRGFTVRAARARVHVLCEKPMAVTEGDARAMLRACARGGAKLMIAYRETTAAVLRFPGERIANFTSSFAGVLAAIERSAREGRPVRLPRLRPMRRPRLEQETHRPAGGSPRLVRADDPRPE